VLCLTQTATQILESLERLLQRTLDAGHQHLLREGTCVAEQLFISQPAQHLLREGTWVQPGGACSIMLKVITDS